MGSLVVFCSIIALCSALGGSLPAIVKLTHRRIQLALSFVSGVMLGVALLHLLPHAFYALNQQIELTLLVTLVGLLFMFFMVRMFHFHQHDLAVDKDHDHRQKELCDHGSNHHHPHCESHDGSLDLSWLGLCFGLAIHTLIDGIALAAAVLLETRVGFGAGGLGVFLAIVLHKPLDALSITLLMAVRGWSSTRQIIVSLVFSLMCPLGALAFAMGINLAGEHSQWVLGIALAFSAGIFLCISLGDLLPEVHFHSHDRGILSVMLILGVTTAFCIELSHDHGLRKLLFPKPEVEQVEPAEVSSAASPSIPSP